MKNKGNAHYGKVVHFLKSLKKIKISGPTSRKLILFTEFGNPVLPCLPAKNLAE